ncbi:MAG: GNAT family N-acetyltransferase [Legionella sp.]|nr:GNAT family N-acetyltransferase [Legionella sp.]
MRIYNNPLHHDISIKENDEGLQIIIQTERLIIRSIELKDEKACFDLFGDPDVMKKYADGLPYTEEKKKSRFEMWTKRWKEHDPYSAYMVFEKESGHSVGIIGIGHAARGESELFYATFPDCWGKGYGTVMVRAVVQSLVPRLMMRGYKPGHGSLKKLEADVDMDNPASHRILLKVGFQQTGLVNRFGAWRQSYSVFSKQLINEYHHFFDNKDRAASKEAYLRSVDEGVDVTVAEMAASSFGRF